MKIKHEGLRYVCEFCDHQSTSKVQSVHFLFCGSSAVVVDIVNVIVVVLLLLLVDFVVFICFYFCSFTIGKSVL